jgi:ADP-ribose pyrophosphatase YjhB (NUDIX family)/predicted transcriptional regulator
MIQNIELRILLCFEKTDSRQFADICKSVGLATDLGGYYLRRLVSRQFLTKTGRGTYTITFKGKQQLAVSFRHKLEASRPRVIAMVVASQAGKYVVLERAWQPFIGKAEWPASAVAFGESFQAAAGRVLEERLGVIGQPRFAGMFRRTDEHRSAVFDDKLFLIHTIDIPAQTAIARQTVAGQNKFLAAAQIRQLPNPSKSLIDVLEYVISGAGTVAEKTYHLESNDLYLDGLPDTK